MNIITSPNKAQRQAILDILCIATPSFADATDIRIDDSPVLYTNSSGATAAQRHAYVTIQLPVNPEIEAQIFSVSNRQDQR